MAGYRRVGFTLALGLVALGATSYLQRIDPTLRHPAAPPRSTAPNVRYGNIPLSFEENAGQTAPEVRFLSRGAGYTLFITPTESVAVLAKRSPAPRSADAILNRRRQENQQPASVLRTRLIGANTRPVVRGEEPLDGKSNYLIGNDPSKWRRNVAQYAKVRLAEVYPGIDMVYYGNQSRLEYDYVVRPGGDPRQIRFQFDGAEKIDLDPSGDLLLHVSGGLVRQQLPLVYQERDGRRRQVRAAYRQLGDREFGVEVASYDTTRPIVIDPAIAYSTYVGGAGDDEGFDIAVDNFGNAYVTGFSTSTDFPAVGSTRTNAGAGDVFVVKLNQRGNALSWSTVFGGNQTEFGNGIAVDSSGNAVVTGQTLSPDFPTTPGALLKSNQSGVVKAFVTKLTPDGSDFVYSTYLGGNVVDAGEGIAVDNTGSAYVTGFTGSANFPVTPLVIQGFLAGAINAFVTKLNPDGSLAYSTFIGGNTVDEANGIAIDSAHNAYITGYTKSPNFPTTAGAARRSLSGAMNGFVTEVSANAEAFLYSTYFIGTGSDTGQRIAVDSSGSAVVVGNSASPETSADGGDQQAKTLQPEAIVASPNFAFVVRVNSTGTDFIWETRIKGNADTFGQGVVLMEGSIFVTGFSKATDLPTVGDPIQPAHAADSGASDGFVAELGVGNGAVTYLSYDGGKLVDHDLGITADTHGNIFVVGVSNSFSPATPGGKDNPEDHLTPESFRQFGPGGGFDIRVLKLSFNADTRRHSIVLHP